jgi:hypothetical protein
MAITKRRLLDAYRDRVLPVKLQVCDPQGEAHEKIKHHFTMLEPLIKEKAGPNGCGMMIFLVDKAKQTAINNLFGRSPVGDEAINIYWEIICEAAALIAMACSGKKVSVNVYRVAGNSDEAVVVVTGERLTKPDRNALKRAWGIARSSHDLKRRRFNLDGKPRVNLEQMSETMIHPEAIVAAHILASDPIRITSKTEDGFVLDAVRRVEDDEISGFISLVPDGFRQIQGVAEVSSPLGSDLTRQHVQKKDSGFYVEIKMETEMRNCQGLFDIIREYTRKGLAEAHFGRFGMRGMNTIAGKARANKFLSAVVEAMFDFGKETESMVCPVSSGYLTYWVDLPRTSENIRKIEEAIQKRLGAHGISQFRPNLVTTSASGLQVDDVRARMILDSIDRQSDAVSVLDRTDFLVSFVANIDHPARLRILQEIGIPPLDRRNFEIMEAVCGREVRSTEDMVAKIRWDDRIIEQVATDRRGYEEWMFDFAREKAEDMRSRLILLAAGNYKSTRTAHVVQED